MASAVSPGFEGRVPDGSIALTLGQQAGKKMIWMGGLTGTKDGAVLSLRSGKIRVTDGPFSEAKELVGGYWIIQAKDRDEALEWAKRVPQDANSFVEVRQIYELSEFAEDIQDAAQLSTGEPPHQTSA